MICKDPFVKELRRLGYNPVRLPRTGIEPLQIIGRDWGKQSILGELKDLCLSSEALPTIKSGAAANIRVCSTEKLRTSLGLKLMEPLLASLGVNVPKLQTAYRVSRRIRITVKEPEWLKVDLFTVGQYLAKGDFDAANPAVQKFLFSAGCSTLVITEVLKAKSITLEAEDEKGQEAALNLQVVQKAAGGDVNVESQSTGKGVLTYKGKKAMAFAFVAHGIAVEDGQWCVSGLDLASHLGGGKAGKTPPPAMFAEDDFVEI